MVASLARFGADFGAGPFDSLYFQRDRDAERTAALKHHAPAHRRFVVGDDQVAIHARAEALEWMLSTLALEHPDVLRRIEQDSDADDEFDAIARHVQEDFAILHAGDDDSGRTLVVDVRFPSGWRPERLKDANFDAIHAPVPSFPPNTRASKGMVRAMVDRGPYVRFVWTVGADGGLDHHPELGDRVIAWPDASEVFFRVERQVTVPLPRTRSSVFLIRTYVDPIKRLSREQIETIRRAIEVMPSDVRRYKSLPELAVFDAAVRRALR